MTFVPVANLTDLEVGDTMLVDELRGKAVTDRRVNTGFKIIERGST